MRGVETWICVELIIWCRKTSGAGDGGIEAADEVWGADYIRGVDLRELY